MNFESTTTTSEPNSDLARVLVPALVPCPNPLHMVLVAGLQNVLNNIVPGDFSAAQLAAPRMGINDSNHDRFFLCTIKWQLPASYCHVTRAELTVKMRSNKAGLGPSTLDAGNDTIGIVRAGGGAVPGFSAAIYSTWPFGIGTTSTKTFDLTGSELTHLNSDRRLSFCVKDNTMVESAVLELWGCCVIQQ